MELPTCTSVVFNRNKKKATWAGVKIYTLYCHQGSQKVVYSRHEEARDVRGRSSETGLKKKISGKIFLSTSRFYVKMAPLFRRRGAADPR